MNESEKLRIFRQRFRGRPDVYGHMILSKPDENGKQARSFAPVCSNFWTDVCDIKNKVGGCARCKSKVFTPVSDESVLKHINGAEHQIQYVLQEDGNINFGAIDFDMKPGKESQGYDFRDVIKVITILKERGIPYGIARSTGQGYHIYFFFSEPYSAVKFRAFLWWIYEITGFISEHRQCIRPLPEMFPKQGSAFGGLGNGIKPPMIEVNWSKERNGFVTDRDEFIPPNLQWQHLDQIQKITPAQMDEAIKKEGIEVQVELVSTTKSSSRKRDKYQRPLHGSYEKILEGCAAFRRVRDNCLKGIQPNHFEGMALWHMAMHTVDGMDWFRKNVPGWAKTDADMRQMEHSVDKEYSPWTCKKLQESGVCVPGTKCFEKKPPIERVEGRTAVRDDLPESEWPDPSPIRYAFSAGDDFLSKLLKEVEDLKAEADDEKRRLKLAEIIRRSMVFDNAQQDLLKRKIEESGIEKKAQLNKRFKEAQVQKQKEFVDLAKERDDSIICGSMVYRKRHPHGFAIIKQGKGDSESSRELCGFDIIFEEEKTIVSNERAKTTVFIGKLSTSRRTVPFEIDSEIWSDNSEMFKFFTRLVGTDFNILKSDIDLLRQVSAEYRKKSRVISLFYDTQGWYDETYLMPSVLVDKDGIRPNTEQKVDLSDDSYTKLLDFKLLSDSDSLETLFHIKKDFFNAFPRGPLFLGIGHCMMSGILGYLRLPRGFKPVLWYEGLTGAGKTQLCILLANFWGDFRGPVNWTSTANGMLDYGHKFKDALLVADDYKGSTHGMVVAVKNTVQYSYDEFSAKAALTRTGKQRGSISSRCLFIMTGEETPVNEASFIARLTLVEYPKYDTTKTQKHYEACLSHSENYRGVTPKFIHWVLQQDRNSLLKDIGEVRDTLKIPIAGKQNDNRIASNTGLAFCGWKWFVRFMQDAGALDREEADSLIQEGWEFTQHTRDIMARRCSEEQNGAVFLDNLKSLLFTGEALIENLEGFSESKRPAPVIGFVDDKDKTPNVIYIIPNKAIPLVKRHVADSFVISEQSAGNQLKAMGIIADHEANRSTLLKRYKGGNGIRVWCLDINKLGLQTSTGPRVVHQTEPLKLDKPIPDADGLI